MQSLNKAASADSMEVKPLHGKGNNVIFDCSGCDSKALADEAKVRDFLNYTVEFLGMKKLCEPVVVKHEPAKKQERGITGFVIIAESHVSIHTYPEKSLMFVDIFSCKEFDTEKAASVLEKFFSPEKIEKSTSFRGSYNPEIGSRPETIKGVTNAESIADLVSGMKNFGFQATHLGKGAEIIRKMQKEKCTIFLSFTSNMVSSGLREIFAHMVKNKMVDAIVTTVGSVEEDFMKTEKPFLLGSFDMDDRELHQRGINRIGNILVPNDRYEWLEKKLQPFFKEMYEKQKKSGKPISPREIIYELGKTVQDENSIIYWATKNNIPIFCPAITDGAFGLQVYLFKQDYPDFSIDVTADMSEIANIVMGAKKTGGIILGGGSAKHYTIGVNILRDGMDYAVYVSTATEYDGSLSGAKVKEAVSWGKVKEDASSVYIEGDATIVFPLLFSVMRDGDA